MPTDRIINQTQTKHTGSAIDGMTSFSYPLAQSYIADITEPAKLSQAYGLFQVRASVHLIAMVAFGVVEQPSH